MTKRAVLGRYFEEFEVGGREIGPGRTVTEHDVMAFAGLSGDYNPLHTDEGFARETPHGGRIAHGMLGASIATGLASKMRLIDGTALAFLGLDWKFRKAVRFGDTVRLEVEVTDKRSAARMGGGIVTFGARLVNQRDEVVQRGTWQMLIRSRPEQEGGGHDAA